MKQLIGGLVCGGWTWQPSRPILVVTLHSPKYHVRRAKEGKEVGDRVGYACLSPEVTKRGIIDLGEYRGSQQIGSTPFGTLTLKPFSPCAGGSFQRLYSGGRLGSSSKIRVSGGYPPHAVTGLLLC